MKKEVPVIETERLVLFGIRREDAETIVLWRSDPDVYQYFYTPHAITMEEHMTWYNENYLNNPDRMSWMCIQKSTGRRIGIFGIKKDCSTPEEAEISYLLCPDGQHQGYGAEAVEGIIRWCRKEGIHEMKAVIHEKNRASIIFIEKMGFQPVVKEDSFVTYKTCISLVRGGYWKTKIIFQSLDAVMYQVAA